MTDPKTNTARVYSALLYIAAGVLVGMAASKYSAKIAHAQGYELARAEITREAHCVDWWFNDSTQRIREAKFYACQNRKDSLK